MSTQIRQVETFDADPADIHDLLTNSERFAAMTGGAPATIDATPGGEISLFGGAIVGRTIENVAGRRIVQAWRPGSWEEGLYSIVRFELEEGPRGVEVTLTHNGFPEEEIDHLSQGWVDNYWDPMKNALAN